MLVNMLEDRALVKSIASADKDCYDAVAGGVEGEEGVKIPAPNQRIQPDREQPAPHRSPCQCRPAARPSWISPWPVAVLGILLAGLFTLSLAWLQG